MSKLNNKGQTLVLFVILLPIFLFVIVLVVDIGNLISVKQNINNINYMMIDYGLSNLEKENLQDEIKKYILLNVSDLDNIKIEIKDKKIKIYIQKYQENLLSQIFDMEKFEIISAYEGSLEGENKKIERIK